METEQIVQLDPAHVLATDNSRWGTKPRDTDVERLMNSILEHGGVMEAVEVSEIPKSDESRKGGFTHRLTFGFNRHEAVSRLNKEQNAGLTLPAVVREIEDGTARIKRQVAENNDRASLSPMDKAISIKRLLDSGVLKADVRRIFSASGGRKGDKVQPMSNAMVNILLNLLDLPKALQEKVHTGVIGIEGAYQLGKVAPDKRAAVVARAEKDYASLIEQQEKDEKKYLEAESRVTETEAKVGAADVEVVSAQADVETATQLVKDKIEAMKTVNRAIAEMDTPAGPKEVESIKAAQADVKGAQKTLKDAKNKLAKQLGLKTAAEQAVDAVKAKLEASRKAVKAAKKGQKAIGKTAIERAAKAEGVGVGLVPLSIAEIRQVFKDLVNGKEGADDRVVRVTTLFKACLDGKDTPKELVINLNALLDSMGAKLRPAPVKTMPAAPLANKGKVPAQATA